MGFRYGREEEQIGMPGSGPLTLRLPPHPLKSGNQILRATGPPLSPSAPAMMHGLQEIPPCEGLYSCKAALHRARQSLLCSPLGQDQRLPGGTRMPLWETHTAASQPQLLREVARPLPLSILSSRKPSTDMQLCKHQLQCQLEDRDLIPAPIPTHELVLSIAMAYGAHRRHRNTTTED